jgi:hypothetical protein
MCYDLDALAVKGPPRSPRPDGGQIPIRRPRKNDSKDEKVKGSPKVGYRRPRRVDTEAEEHIAAERHHRAELEEEARSHMGHGKDADGLWNKDEDLEKERVQGLNFDERRKKKGKKRDDEPDHDEESEDGEAAAEAAKSAKEQGLLGADGAGRYFQDMPEDRLGDPSLTNPNDMKRALGPTVRFAQHAMLLAQSRIEEGMSRAEAIGFMAKLFVDCGDREYAKKALKEFGPATGILDLYPLELIQHLVENVPMFYTHVQRGRFFTSSVDSRYRAKAGETIHLSYPPDLRIRGFAIRGGARPGYLLEPTEPQGTYALTFQTEGTFDVVISAIGPGGALLIEEMVCEIEAGDATAFEANAAIERERAAEAEAHAEADRADKPKLPVAEELRLNLKQRI